MLIPERVKTKTIKNYLGARQRRRCHRCGSDAKRRSSAPSHPFRPLTPLSAPLPRDSRPSGQSGKAQETHLCDFPAGIRVQARPGDPTRQASTAAVPHPSPRDRRPAPGAPVPTPSPPAQVWLLGGQASSAGAPLGHCRSLPPRPRRA